MIATFVATGSHDIANQLANVTRDTKTGHRTIVFEGTTFYISIRPTNGLFVSPGINIYFGDAIAAPEKYLPQKWKMTVNIHILAPYTNEPLVGENQALRLSESVQDAFEGFGGRLQVYDFTNSPPVPMSGRFVSWSRSPRGVWKELGDPTEEDYTNRQWTIEVRYVR